MNKKSSRRKMMNPSTTILVVITLGLLLFALIRDKSLALDGIKIAGTTIWNNLILLSAGFLLAGLVQVLLPKSVIGDWLGDQSGIKGVLTGCVAGGLMPGSPYAVFPMVGGLYKAGAGLGALVGFITAWSLWSVSRLPVEFALMDPQLVLIRYAITFFFPPLAGVIAQVISSAFLKGTP
jgi:uncharacterized membrane protein YraQ (UPF0718 family)